MLRFILTAMCVALLWPTPLNAEEKPTTTKPTTSAAVVEVTDKDKIKSSVGQELTVRGKVIEVYKAQSGRVLFNFEGIGRRDFNVMIQKANTDAVNAGLGGDVEPAVKDKIITVTGTVALYRENPQIEVTKPEQIKVQEEKKE